MTALHHAVLSGFEDTVQTLLQAGSDLNAESSKYGTPLCLAATKARNNIITLLLNNRAKLHTPDGPVGSALHCAAISGDTSTVKLLVENGCDPNVTSAIWLPRNVAPPHLAFNHGNIAAAHQSRSLKFYTLCQPLHLATRSNELMVVSYLLDQGAVIDGEEYTSNGPGTPRVKGRTPLAIAAECGFIEILTSLLDRGSDVNLKDHRNMSALMLAARGGDYDCIQQLIQHKARIDEQEDNGETALMKAVQSTQIRCVKALITAGANLNIKNEAGQTAMHQAAKTTRSEIATTLLKVGADPNVKDGNGLTPLDIAIEQKAYESAHELARYRSQCDPSSNSYSLIRLLHTTTLKYRVYGIFQSQVPVPRYAMLSHRREADEITFREFRGLSIDDRRSIITSPRGLKLERLCEEAKRHSIEWICCDTCCVDGKDETELYEADFSRIAWQTKAEKIFILLRDVPVVSHYDADIRRSIYFTHSWMLQELLANKSEAVLFYDRDWRFLGTRSTLSSHLCEALRIRREHLHNYTLACAAAKLS